MRIPFPPLLAAAFLAAACTSAPPTVLPDPTPVSVDPAIQAPAEAPSRIAEQPALDTSVAEAPSAAPPAEADRGPTDPSTVQLAAGQPQFVEFYADW